MERLIAANVLTCPACRAPLTGAGAGARCPAGHAVAARHGVVDLYIPGVRPEPAPLADAAPKIAAAFAGQLGLDPADVLAANLLEPLPPTGDPFLDAEEQLFVERFGFANVLPKIEFLKIYGGRRMRAGETHWLALRIRNGGLFPVSSLGDRPLVLSYHWLRTNGETLVFEGRRSALPVDIAPGQAVSAHLAIDVPKATGAMRLQILPVHESVAWLENDSVAIDVEVVEEAPHAPPQNDGGRPFDEILDNELAEAFLDARFASFPVSLVGLEIGGATSAALSEWALHKGRDATIVNGDISVRLLRVAALLAAKRHDAATVQARLAAERLPFRDGALNVVVFRRALHHFDDPVVVLRECARVLAPEGLIFLLCEPVATTYDDATRDLIRAGVNEQVFPLDGYRAMFAEAGLSVLDIACDWGFSLKVALRRAS